MYIYLLSAHSIIRWFVVIGVIYTLFRAYSGLFNARSYGKNDDIARKYTVISAHIQFVLGILLYFFGPLTKYFMSNFSTAIKIKEIRFYGMEHSVVMLLAIILLTIGSAISKKKTEDSAKLKTLAIWFTIALILILLMTPWPFSMFSERPLFRLFY